jgi:hypothetical protein
MKMKSSFVLLFILCFFSYSKGQSLYLLSPISEANYVQPYPIFTWQLSGISHVNISYTIQIAKYKGIENINDSLIYTKTIQSNNPFQIFYYPTIAPKLLNCQEYMWQVTASYSTYTTQEPEDILNTYNYSSPISHFITSGCIPSEAPSPLSPSSKLYIEPIKQIDNFVHLVSDSLYIKYKEPYDTTQVAYSIYNSDTIISSSTIPVLNGLNYLDINLEGLGIQPTTIYMFELKTAKGDLLRTKFEKQ